MHHLKLKAAVAKYTPLHAAGASPDELTAAIMEDEKGYSAEDAAEIIASMGKSETIVPQKQPAANGMIDFEKWQAKGVYKFKFDENTGEREKYLAEVVKTGNAPMSVHRIEQRQADELNRHLDNNNVYYFPKS